MPSNLSFTCSKCGEAHTAAPSFSFKAPIHYPEEATQKKLGRIFEDSCFFCSNDQVFSFVRAIMEIPILGFDQPFSWKIWVALRNNDFQHYLQTLNTPSPDIYIGALANELSHYSNTTSIKVSISRRKENLIRYIEPEHSDHPLAVDYYRGISIKRAQEIIEHILHANNDNNVQ